MNVFSFFHQNQKNPRAPENFDTAMTRQAIYFTPPDMTVLNNLGGDDGFGGFSYVNPIFEPIAMQSPRWLFSCWMLDVLFLCIAFCRSLCDRLHWLIDRLIAIWFLMALSQSVFLDVFFVKAFCRSFDWLIALIYWCLVVIMLPPLECCDVMWNWNVLLSSYNTHFLSVCALLCCCIAGMFVSFVIVLVVIVFSEFTLFGSIAALASGRMVDLRPVSAKVIVWFVQWLACECERVLRGYSALIVATECFFSHQFVFLSLLTFSPFFRSQDIHLQYQIKLP